MSRQAIINELNELVTGGNPHDQIFYFDGTYKAVEEGKLTEITPEEAAEYVTNGSKLIYIQRDYRTWDDQQRQFVGEEPTHPPLPGMPTDADILNITCAFPCEVITEIFIGKQYNKGSE